MNNVNKWQVKPLGEVCETTSGGTPSRGNKSYYNGTIPWVKSGELNKGVIYDTEEKITEEAIKNSSAKVFPKGTLLIALYGATIGKLAFLGVEAATNQAVCGIYKNESMNSKYIYNFLFHKKQDLVKQGIGGAQPNISQTILKKLELPIPPLETQNAIVSKIEELFSDIDKGIEDLKIAQQQLKTYRQSVLKWAFEGKLTNENLKEGELPKGWKIVDLKEVCEIKRGKSKHRPRNAPELYGGNYPFIQTGDIRNANGGYIKRYSQTYSEIGLAQSKLWPKGTLCITIAANIGETAILDFDACFPDSVVGLLPKDGILFNKYLNYFFISFKQKLEELAPATAQKNINVDILEKINIPIAPFEEQHLIVQEIESRLSVADKMEESINESLKQAEALRQSILKKAFNGELV
ncbi:restriction endonuclease subunit S [Flavobacterium soli]|uniref:restriction endonuclease subunit S n=1 Tax=Flavobacterium soli TaxID=344881 RepID=UPI000422D661|nr:restriction endonuclease subunit S [Flavobacterium soli]